MIGKWQINTQLTQNFEIKTSVTVAAGLTKYKGSHKLCRQVLTISFIPVLIQFLLTISF